MLCQTVVAEVQYQFVNLQGHKCQQIIICFHMNCIKKVSFRYIATYFVIHIRTCLAKDMNDRRIYIFSKFIEQTSCSERLRRHL